MQDNTMVKPIKVTREQAIVMAMKMRNAIVPKEDRLTHREIECLTEIMLFGIYNEVDSLSPYSGVGRERICEKLSLSSNQYSRILRRLTDARILFFLGKRGSYLLSPDLLKYFDVETLKNGGVMKMYTYYEIIDNAAVLQT